MIREGIMCIVRLSLTYHYSLFPVLGSKGFLPQRHMIEDSFWFTKHIGPANGRDRKLSICLDT